MSEQIIARLMPEWLSSNQHRAYPLDETTIGDKIPTPLLVDALLLVSPNIDRESVYVSSIIKDGTNIHMTISWLINKDINKDISQGKVHVVIPYNTTMGTHVPILYNDNGCTICGEVVIGNIHCVDAMQTITEITKDGGRFFPGCVHTSSDTLLGIKVRDTIYTGVVTLEAGDGIDLAVATDSDGGTTITINSTPYMMPVDNKLITTDEELLKAAIDLYGKPVRTICDTLPDDAGNIVLAAPGSGKGSEQYVTAISAGEGAVCLTIANDTTDTTCTDDSAMIESIMQNLSNLNNRAGDQHEMILGLEDAVSNLSLQISRI
jgi:hypothetical protein